MKKTISQCMIVKNEEKNIRRALSWGKDIMCEQIVVDTGSSDRTVEIAREMGAKIFFFPWINDFAAAKNFAIDQAKGDWIAFLDADESFTPEDTKKIPEILEYVGPDRSIAVPTFSVSILSQIMPPITRLDFFWLSAYASSSDSAFLYSRIVNIRYILSLSGECVIFSVYYFYFTTKSAIMPL